MFPPRPASTTFRQIPGRLARLLSAGLSQLARLPRRARWFALTAGVLLGVGATYAYLHAETAGDGKTANGERPRGGPGGPGGPGGGRIQPVKAATARIGTLEVSVAALGTVTASNSATVKARVDGQLVKILFREGQLAKTGDVLAEIDPRPYQIQLDQVHGQLIKDQALLSAAQVDLGRYRALLAKDSIAKQQVDTQEALLRQYQGIVEADQAQEANARLQLSFTRITAPAAGRLGLRQVDAGNMVRAADTTGLVVITRTQPIHVVFAIPAESLGDIANRQQQGESLAVDVWSSDGKNRLGQGKLVSVDNQIDVSTSTVKLKAELANADNSLFPNQFVNARLKVATRQDSLLLPTAAIQRNAQGSFVYRINPADNSVEPVPVSLGPTSGEQILIEKGLSAGDLVVLDGADRLRPGSKVDVLSVDGKARDEGADDGQEKKRRRGGEGRRNGDKPGRRDN